MCMKCVNTDIIFFSDSEDVAYQNQINLICDKIPLLIAKKTDLNNILVIPKVEFMLLVNATEKLNEDGTPNHTADENPNNTFFFSEDYEIRLRITETESGKFIDLGDLPIQPKNEKIKLCRNIFIKREMFKYCNINIAATTDFKKDTCVLKVLIRKVTKDEQQENKWYVQSAHPIMLDIQDCQC